VPPPYSFTPHKRNQEQASVVVVLPCGVPMSRTSAYSARRPADHLYEGARVLKVTVIFEAGKPTTPPKPKKFSKFG